VKPVGQNRSRIDSALITAARAVPAARAMATVTNEVDDGPPQAFGAAAAGPADSDAESAAGAEDSSELEERLLRGDGPPALPRDQNYPSGLVSASGASAASGGAAGESGVDPLERVLVAGSGESLREWLRRRRAAADATRDGAA
jgi:hypothetical protein